MWKHCSFRAGGTAKYYCEPKSRMAMAEIVKLCKEIDLKFFLLGNGTNVIFYSFDGLIICTKNLRSIVVLDDYIIVESGVPMMRLNMFVGECGFSGLEWSYGIPGSVGGAVIMNAGAYGHEICEVIEKVEIFDGKRFKTLKKNKIWFKYRNSCFKENQNIVTRVYIKLIKNADSAQIKEKMFEHFEKRKTNHPMEYPSAGSVFKRNGEMIPSRLIDSLGLKGKSINGAEVSTKHAGFIVNKGGATAEDIENLINYVKQEAKEKAGIELEQEVIIIKE